MSGLTSEIITFLLTDIQGSTRMWESYRDRMAEAVSRHDALAEAICVAHEGELRKKQGEGDSLFMVFKRPSDAVGAAGALQQAYRAEEWPTPEPIRVRMALHAGEADERDGDYYGRVVNRCARIRGIGHGGQILLSELVYSLVRDSLPPDLTVQPLGLHRLRDLDRPEQIYQLNYPGCPPNFPNLLSLDAYRHNLPRGLTSFIGRETEIAEVGRRLRTAPLLTITGSGGSGKTRLALQAAAETVEEYADGVCLVELAPLSDGELAPKAIADALHIPEEPGSPILETLRRQLANKNLLLLLDNCEHLDRACASLANTLLTSCSRLRILATSLTRLGVPGEVSWRVPSLAVPESGTTLQVADALNYAAVRLFVERAMAIQSRFMLTAANLPAVVRICRRVDGIPLCIELAAARVSVLTVEEIAERLDQSFRILKTSDTEIPARHQTLQALIDWSHNLLSKPQRVLLRRLSVFAGGWTLAAAETTCADEPIDELDVLDLLSELVNASLVIAEERNGVQRYRLLETVRQYSLEQLDRAGETERQRDRHLHYFLDLAEDAAPHFTMADSAEWLARLDAEHDNLRAALSWAGDAVRLQLAGALWRFWMLRNYLAEGRSRLEGALQRARNSEPSARSRALTGLGMLMARLGDSANALTVVEDALALRRAAGDLSAIAETTNILGIMKFNRGDFPGAQQCYEESLRLWQQVGSRWFIASTYNNLGMIARETDTLAKANYYYMQSLTIYRELGDETRIASVLSNLGAVAYNQQNYEHARQFSEEAVERFRRLEDRWEVARMLHNLADSLIKLNRHSEATPLLIESLTTIAEHNDKSTISYPLLGMVQVVISRQQPMLAARLLGAVAATVEHDRARLGSRQQQEYDENMETVQRSLDKERFLVAWQEGTTLSIDEIIATVAPEIAS
jgi:predicted ATPase/class 3 adenylate cyclase